MTLFFFYGTLRDRKLRKNVVGHEPIYCTDGSITGDLYEIEDPSDPTGIVRYPALVPRVDGHLVVGTVVGYDLSVSALKEVRARLTEFEGDAYCLQELACVLKKNGALVWASVFIARDIAALAQVPTIRCSTIEPKYGVVRWTRRV